MPLKQVNFKVDVEVLKELDRLAEKEGQGRSSFLRSLIHRALAEDTQSSKIEKTVTNILDNMGGQILE